MKAALLILIFLSSCSSFTSGSPKEGKKNFAYIDGSGRFGFSREHKLLKTKLISRTQITETIGSTAKPLEKSIMVSQLGTVKNKRGRSMVMRPFASEFTVWLDGKRYESKMRLDPKNKAMTVDLDSPEAKWKGSSSIAFPKGQIFCFYNQLPDCLFHSQLLTKTIENKGSRQAFYVVWESYPYLQEQFSGVGSKLFAPAVLKYEGEQKSQHRFLVEVEGQGIVYHFSKSFDLVRMFWIAQGISIVPPNEEMSDIDE